MAEPYVALVTGGNRGIGLEVCRQLAAAGLEVVLGARTRDRAEQAARTLKAGGIDVAWTVLGVTGPESIAAAARDLAGRFGRVDVLVNNAAILVAEDSGILDTADEELRGTFDTNVFGAVAVARAFVPGMVARGYGRVVNVSSGAGQLTHMTTYAPAYSMSKAALNAFTRVLAAETRGTGVLVNSADPGWVRTDMGGPNAPRSVAQGADTIVWLATLPTAGPTAGFYSDRRQVAW